MSHLPGLFAGFPRNDADSHAGRMLASFLLDGRLVADPLRVLDRRGADVAGGLQSRFRRTGNEDARKQMLGQGGSHFQILDLVVLAVEADSLRAFQQPAHDLCVFRQPHIALVVRCRVVECEQIVAESAGNHVHEEPPVLQKSVRRNHLGRCVRVHVCGLDSYQRTQRRRVLQNDVGHQPWIADAVVGVYEDSFAAVPLAPAGHIRNLLSVIARVPVL